MSGKSRKRDRPAADGRDRVGILQAALEHMDEGVSVMDENLVLVAWNQRFIDLLDFPQHLARHGVRFEEFIRYNAERGEYGPGDPDDLVKERVEKALQFVPHVFQRRRPDGTVIEVRGNPIPGLGFVTVYKDISEQKRAEEALQESVDTLEERVRARTDELSRANALMAGEIERRRQAIESLEASERWIRFVTDAVPVLIGYVDCDRIYRFANLHYERWFGPRASRLVGQHVRDVFKSPLYPGHYEDVEQVLAGERIVREFVIEPPEGGSIEVSVAYVPHIEADGRVLGYFVLGQNVTERRYAENALRQAQRMEAIGQLTGGIAHDFNNLLTIVIGNLALLGEVEPGSEPAREIVSEALGAARLGADLVKRLLAFSRARSLSSEVYDPRQVVSGMHALLSRTLGQDIRLSVAFDGSDWLVRTDPSELENALLNLAINSRDAMPEGGSLAISVEACRLPPNSMQDGQVLPAGEVVRISVADSGCGMTPEIRERACEPFFTGKAVGAGTGLGLSMVYGFVQRSGGALVIDSAPGEGTCVRLYLPRHQGEAEEGKTEQRGAATGGRERILLVEDDRRVRSFAARCLASLGYRVAEAANGAEAIDRLAADPPFDLLLSDIEMPGGLSGLQLARRAEEFIPGLAVLLMTGSPDRALAQNGGRAEWRVLAKPFERQDLAQAVRRLLDGRPAAVAGKRRLEGRR